MLWYPDETYGIAQGCYTIYDATNQTLWAYEYAAQHDSHRERAHVPRMASQTLVHPEVDGHREQRVEIGEYAGRSSSSCLMTTTKS